MEEFEDEMGPERPWGLLMVKDYRGLGDVIAPLYYRLKLLSNLPFFYRNEYEEVLELQSELRYLVGGGNPDFRITITGRERVINSAFHQRLDWLKKNYLDALGGEHG